jgi:HEAT repeat protein
VVLRWTVEKRVERLERRGDLAGLARLLRDSDERTVGLAVEAVQRVGGDRTLPILLDGLDHSPPSSRWPILKRLATIDHPVVVEQLARWVTDPTEVGWWAISGLGAHPGPDVLHRLVTALVDGDLRGDNRGVAEEVVTRMSETLVFGVDPGARPAVVPKEPKRPVDVRVVASVGRVAVGAASTSMRRTGIETLNRIGGPDAAEALRGCLRDLDTPNRYRAWEHYLRLDPTPPAEVVDRALDDVAGHIRRLGVETVFRIDPQRATERVSEWLRDEAPEVRLAVPRGLAAVDRSAEVCLAVLRRSAVDPDEEVREGALEVAERFDDPGLAGALAPMLADAVGEMRRRAARLLRRWKWDGDPVQLAIATPDWPAVEHFGAAAAAQLVLMLRHRYTRDAGEREYALPVLERIVVRHGAAISGSVLREAIEIDSYWGKGRAAGGTIEPSVPATTLHRVCRELLRDRTVEG